MRRLVLAVALAFALMPVAQTPALAVEPDEILDDPVLEARARELSKELRCLVCRNESIDESNAELARDLRILVRERMVEGDTDAEALAYIVDRYGEFVLLRPQASGSTLILWAAGPTLLVIALGVSLVYLRRRRPTASPTAAPLSDEERRRLDEILRD